MGKEMAINKPLSGLGWRLKLDGLFSQECSSMSKKTVTNCYVFCQKCSSMSHKLSIN